MYDVCVPVAMTTIVTAVDVYQGVSSPLVAVFCVLVVSTIRGIMLWQRSSLC